MSRATITYAATCIAALLFLILATPGSVRPTGESSAAPAATKTETPTSTTPAPATPPTTPAATTSTPSPAPTATKTATSSAAPAACCGCRKLTPGELKRIRNNKAAITSIQQCYAKQGWYTGPIDGIVGSLTIKAMEQSCSGSPANTAPPQDGLGVVYRLTRDDLEWMKSKNDVLDKLDPLQNVEFESRYDFVNAVKSCIGESYDRYRDLILEAAEQPGQPSGDADGDLNVSFMLGDSFFAEQRSSNLPKPVVERLAELVGSEYPTRSLFENALRVRVETPLVAGGDLEKGEFTTGYLEKIRERARKTERFDESKLIAFKGWSCGCVRDDLKGEVYGFVPFWSAGVKRELDFSVLTRIGYFALGFDDRGNIAKRFDMTKERAGFINTARRYNTSVDLVIYNNDWRAWSRMLAAKQSTIGDSLIESIATVAAQRLDNSLLNRAKPWITLGMSRVPPIVDGVTLYFDGYPRDDAASDYLVSFITRLKTRLRQVGKGSGWYYNLNIVLPMDDLGTGVFRESYLKQLVPKVEQSDRDEFDAQNDVDLFIVMLDEPTGETKKKLRQDMEKMLKGIQRRNMLRKIVPLLNPAVQPPETTDNHQFFDDLVYFEDNFGGVAFWPAPFSDMQPAAEINRQITIAFEDSGYNDVLNHLFTRFFPSYCRLVGPNRWPVRIVFDLLALLMLIYFLLSFRFFELRLFFRKRFFWFLGMGGLAFLLQCSLFACDPFWKYRRSEVVFLAFLALAFVLIWLYVRKMKESDYP